MKIVIVGGSFGGLTAGFELRRLLGRKCEITIIARDRRFVFIPSLPWVVMGATTLDRISFDLEPSLSAKGIRFVEAVAQRFDPAAQVVVTDHGDFFYDYLIIATGHRSANEAVPGLGPFEGCSHSLMSPPEAIEARDGWQRFLEKPGPVVIGCAPGASCLGPAYEFAFEIDYALKRKKMRNRVPITFITPEPFLGHFGVGGFGRARQHLEDAFEERDIRYVTSAAISEITKDQVALSDGRAFDGTFSMVIPPLAGVEAVAGSPGLGNPKAFIPVDARYRHKEYPNIYAVGVAVALPPADATPVPVNFPKTGHMTEQMAKIAAKSIAGKIQDRDGDPTDLFVECIMDMGDKGAHMVADPIRPPRNRSEMSIGKRWLWAKHVFASYYLWRMKRGATGNLGWTW